MGRTDPHTERDQGGEIMFDTMPVPCLFLDQQGAILQANPAALAALGVGMRLLRGRRLDDVLEGDAAMAAALGRCLSEQTALTVADCVVHVPNHRRMATLRIQPQMINGNAGALAVVDLVADHATPSSAMRSAIGMSQMLSHEIKNPLAAISGAAQILSDGADLQDQELTDLIQEESRRIADLLDRVAQFDGASQAQLQPVNLHNGLERAIRSAEIGFAGHMQLKSFYDPSLPEALVDPDQLQQILLNLLRNAAEAGGEGGEIRVRSFYDGALRHEGAPLPLHIEITDNGPGLPADIADQVFAPFVSGRENGTGLGLALVAKMVADNGGLITAASEPGHTRFRISLPAAPTAPKPPKT